MGQMTAGMMNDVVFDAYLANDRTLDDPEVVLPGEAPTVASTLSDDALVALVSGFKQVLGSRVDGVQASTVLRTHPLRLVATANSEMDRMRRMIERDTSAPTRKLEFNQANPIIAGVAARLVQNPDDAIAATVIEQLYASAQLLDGTALDPAAMVKRIEILMQAAVNAPQQ